MRDTAQPLPFFTAARGVFTLSLDAMVWSRRSLMMAVLLGLPIVVAIVYRILATRLPPQMSGFDTYAFILVFFYVGNVVPLVALFYATALVADEVEGKTLTYLLTRPIKREAILAGKYAAYLATTLCLSLPAVILTFFLLVTARGWTGIGGAVPDMFRDLGVVALTAAVYGAFFTLLGVSLRRPVIPGLLFVVIWEWAVHLPGYAPRLTITGWLRSLVRHRPAHEGASEMFGQVLPTVLSLEVLTVMLVAFLAGSIWIFSTREYVMEQ
jgi:ABC-2 type transport system permease protein